MIRHLIVALPRTGSSMLMRVFRDLRGLPFIREPFNRDEHPTLSLPPVRPLTGLTERLAALNDSPTTYAAKHVHDPFHWELGTPLGWTILQSLARLPDCKTVFIHRRNILRQFLSMEVAQQTRNWGITNEATVPKTVGPIRLDGTVPLEAEQVGPLLERLRDTAVAIEEELIRAGANPLVVEYEQVFGESFEATRQSLDAICDHFGVPRFSDVEEPRLRALLDQGERQTKLSRLYAESEGPRKIEAMYGERFGMGA